MCIYMFALLTECFQESEHLKESLKCCLLHLFGAVVAGDQVSFSLNELGLLAINVVIECFEMPFIIIIISSSTK